MYWSHSFGAGLNSVALHSERDVNTTKEDLRHRSAPFRVFSFQHFATFFFSAQVVFHAVFLRDVFLGHSFAFSPSFSTVNAPVVGTAAPPGRLVGHAVLRGVPSTHVRALVLRRLASASSTCSVRAGRSRASGSSSWLSSAPASFDCACAARQVLRFAAFTSSNLRLPLVRLQTWGGVT